MEEPVKGEVRRLADIFCTDDAERASLHVQNVIDSHKHALLDLQKFAQENVELKRLVKDLPNKVSHSIMVPFGKAAFFPGKLVHTNEFLVLLGEGYYAECSAKQTVEILDRRGNLLNSRIDNVKAQLADLDMESRFFSETLAEAAAGVVDIREEFVESELTINSKNNGEGAQLMASQTLVETTISDSKDEDEEHKLLMARLDELEAAEAAAEIISEKVDEDDNKKLILEPNAEPMGEDHSENKVSQKFKETSCSDKLTISMVDGRPDIRSPGDLLKLEEWKRCKLQKEVLDKVIDQKESNITIKSPPVNELVQSVSKLKSEMLIPEESHEQTLDSAKIKEISSASKAFTGAILERIAPSPLDVPKGPIETQKRPISKFKMRQSDR